MLDGRLLIPHSRRGVNVSDELDTTVAPAEDPTEDNREPESDDTATNTPSDEPPVDQANLTRWAQKLADRERRLAEREDRLLALAGSKDTDDEPDTGAALPPDVARELEQARQLKQEMEWAAVRQEIGEPVVDAYEVFYRGYQLDNSPKGALTAFVDAIRHLADTAQPAPTTKPTRAQAVQPRVDTNRPDAPDQNALDKKIEDAKAGKVKDPLGTWIDATLTKAGLR